jgi:hypothetical protein
LELRSDLAGLTSAVDEEKEEEEEGRTSSSSVLMWKDWRREANAEVEKHVATRRRERVAMDENMFFSVGLKNVQVCLACWEESSWCGSKIFVLKARSLFLIDG